MRWPGQARAVERFARAVDPDAGRPEGGRPDAGRPDAGRPDAGRPDGEPDRLVALVDRLRAVNGTSDPDPAFRVGLRERLVATAAAEWAAQPPAETAEAAGPPARPPGRPWVRTRYALAGAFAAVLVVTGLVLASGSALPGDTLYPVKRATERVELAFTFGQEAKGRRCLAEARTRAQEIRALLDRSEPGPGGGPSTRTDAAALSGALDAMDAQTTAGSRLLTTAAVRRTADGPLVELAGWTADQRTLLTWLLDRLPAANRARATDSLDLLHRVADRAAALRTELSCSCLGAATVDDLGPRPCRPCAAVPAGTPVTGSPGSPTSSGSAGPGGGSATGSAATGSGGTGQGSGAPGAGPGGSPAGGNGLPLPTVPGLPLPTNTLPLPTNTLPLPLPTSLLPVPTTTLPLPLPTLPLPT